MLPNIPDENYLQLCVGYHDYLLDKYKLKSIFRSLLYSLFKNYSIQTFPVSFTMCANRIVVVVCKHAVRGAASKDRSCRFVFEECSQENKNIGFYNNIMVL